MSNSDKMTAAELSDARDKVIGRGDYPGARRVAQQVITDRYDRETEAIKADIEAARARIAEIRISS